MARKTKNELIKEAKELGLVPKSNWTMYELEHRIADKKAEIEAEKAKQRGESTPKEPAKTSRRRGGEY